MCSAGRRLSAIAKERTLPAGMYRTGIRRLLRIHGVARYHSVFRPLPAIYGRLFISYRMVQCPYRNKISEVHNHNSNNSSQQLYTNILGLVTVFTTLLNIGFGFNKSSFFYGNIWRYFFKLKLCFNCILFYRLHFFEGIFWRFECILNLFLVLR